MPSAAHGRRGVGRRSEAHWWRPLPTRVVRSDNCHVDESTKYVEIGTGREQKFTANSGLLELSPWLLWNTASPPIPAFLARYRARLVDRRQGTIMRPTHS